MSFGELPLLGNFAPINRCDCGLRFGIVKVTFALRSPCATIVRSFNHDKVFFMFTNKKELIKQVNWALRLREPLCCGEVKDVRSKWTSEGYEVRFDGGSAMIAHFSGRIVAIAWQQMGDVERHLFAKDCDELLHRYVRELGHFDHGPAKALSRPAFHRPSNDHTLQHLINKFSSHLPCFKFFKIKLEISHKSRFLLAKNSLIRNP